MIKNYRLVPFMPMMHNCGAAGLFKFQYVQILHILRKTAKLIKCNAIRQDSGILSENGIKQRKYAKSFGTIRSIN